MSLSTLTNGSFLRAITLKSLTTAAVYSVAYKYFHELDFDYTLLRAFAGSFISSGVAELLMTSIVQRLLSLGQNGNQGIKRIFDQGLNAAISGGINMQAYKMLIKDAPNIEGSKWNNHEEFVAQMIADVIGEVLSYYYLVPLFGLNKTNITTVYG